MDNSFTYIIRSNQKENDADNTNNCSIRLGGLPQQYRYFEASVVGFYVDIKGLTTIATTPLNTIELRADGLNILNGFDTQNNVLRTIAITCIQYATSAVPYSSSFAMPNYKFRFENCNGKSINFKLYDENEVLLQNGTTTTNFNSPWSVVLNLVGYN
jgi:hypothetical protein